MNHLKTITTLLILLGFQFFSSCNNGYESFITSYKEVSISSGGTIEIPISADLWTIEYVEEVASRKKIVDKNGEIMTLKGLGEIDATNNWLSLSRQNNHSFEIHIKEHFDNLNKREFKVYISNGHNLDHITITQLAGAEYKLVKSNFTEKEELRKVYTSNEECEKVTLSNNTNLGIWEPIAPVYKNVKYRSTFQSNDYGAFEWTLGENIDIVTPALKIDHITYIPRNLYKYTDKPFLIPYTNGSTILLNPHNTMVLSGEVTYCERTYDYVFTIQNVNSGTHFEITGTWNNKTVISTNTTSSDK